MKEKTIALNYHKYIIRSIKKINNSANCKKINFELYRHIPSIVTVITKIHFSIDNAIKLKPDPSIYTEK